MISPNPNHGNFTVTAKNIADKQVNMQVTDNNGKPYGRAAVQLKQQA